MRATLSVSHVELGGSDPRQNPMGSDLPPPKRGTAEKPMHTQRDG